VIGIHLKRLVARGNPSGPSEFFEVTEGIAGCADYGTIDGCPDISLIFHPYLPYYDALWEEPAFVELLTELGE
jgi:hypothetical protein